MGQEKLAIGTIDVIVLIAYFLVIVGLGVWLVRKEKTTEDYFVAGRSLPGWAVGLSILGTCISSVTYVAYPGKAFVSDWQYLVQGLTLPLLVIAIGLLVVPFYRKHVKTTVNEFIEMKFGGRVRDFTLLILALSELARIGMVLYLLSLVVNTITDVPIPIVILTLGVITVAYTVAGGIEGTIWTDVLQTVTLVGGGIAVVVLVSIELPGGFTGAISTAMEADKIKLFDFDPTLARPAFFVLFLSGIQNFFYFLAGNQNQVQRYQCVRTDREARKAILIGGLGSVPVWALFMLVGTMLYVYYQQFPDPEVVAFAASGESDKVFPHFIETRIPQGLTGVLLAGLFAAAMSSIDSSMNVLSTFAINDVYKKYIRPDAPDKRAFDLARLMTLIWGVAGIMLALLLVGIGTFLTFYFKAVALLIGVIAGLFALALMSRRAHTRGALVGIALGVLVTAWGLMNLSGFFEGSRQMLRFPWDTIMVGVVTSAVVWAGGWLASVLIPPAKEQTAPVIWDVLKDRDSSE